MEQRYEKKVEIQKINRFQINISQKKCAISLFVE